MVNLFNFIDIFENHSGTIGCGGTDDDVAASQDLLNQGLGIADALDFIEQIGTQV
jgi:hypothetical protein